MGARNSRNRIDPPVNKIIDDKTDQVPYKTQELKDLQPIFNKLLVRYSPPLYNPNLKHAILQVYHTHSATYNQRTQRLLVDVIKNHEQYDFNTVDIRNGFSPLHYIAIGCGTDHKYIHAIMISGADVNTQDTEGLTPIARACWSHCGTIEIIRELINHGADVTISDKHGFTPLHYACITKKNNDVMRLLTESGADLNAVSKNGKTPLLLLCDTFTPVESTILWFIRHSANLNCVDENNWTPIMYLCAYSTTPKAVDAMLEANANTTMCNKDGHDISDIMAIHSLKYHESSTNPKSLYNPRMSTKNITKFKKNFPSKRKQIQDLVKQHCLQFSTDVKVIMTSEQCCICCDLPSETQLFPCGHINTCPNCSMQVDTCPECRVPIIDRIQPDKDISEESISLTHFRRSKCKDLKLFKLSYGRCGVTDPIITKNDLDQHLYYHMKTKILYICKHTDDAYFWEPTVDIHKVYFLATVEEGYYLFDIKTHTNVIRVSDISVGNMFLDDNTKKGYVSENGVWKAKYSLDPITES